MYNTDIKFCTSTDKCLAYFLVLTPVIIIHVSKGHLIYVEVWYIYNMSKEK